ncbi:MAG: tRNA uridine-5-carboxymethylaminomethyl(34) synthesis enzyme MnmG [Bacteroidetes bacterium]|nr:tRNA uridine-5-carboxymethylaminomethyl(34) synthesis enzyme MnmG [Bacteroidota bacterium]
MFMEYDVIVVGAGHAGCEAAAAAANLGSRVLLITMNMMNMAQMSCNPSMGGIAKGQIVREVDALGGYSGIVTDHTMIQFRMLNRSKGPAMWSPRAQNDRMLFSMKWREMLENTPGLDFWQDIVTSILTKDKRVTGVKTSLGWDIMAKSVILTNGTFLNGLIHIGEKNFGGGRIGEPAALGLTQCLTDLGFETKRLKTGTPVRVDGRSINFSKLDEQPGDVEPSRFSFTDTPLPEKQRSCYLAYTSKKVHDILRTGFDKSPMFSVRIEGVGPRYCPSIEDKIDRFSTKERHQLFIEPEGWNTVEYYVNGFSSSLPDYIQFEALRQVEGFENVKIFRPGYAIEYDYFPPEQLDYSLETRVVENLFFAGQINGTTGYEEAAGQGIMAGINAHRKINSLPPLILKRSEAYNGVLIDDLVTKGIDEPYRMFTSRAEYRILLRQDNADLRLTPLSHLLGLASPERMERVAQKKGMIDTLIQAAKKESLDPEQVNGLLEKLGTSPLSQRARLASLVLRPQVQISDLVLLHQGFREIIHQFPEVIRQQCLEEAEILLKYEGYISKEQDLADKLARFENIELHPDFDYHKLTSLSYESREKLSRFKPGTIGQASRIGGVSPADLSVLIVYLGR